MPRGRSNSEDTTPAPEPKPTLVDLYNGVKDGDSLLVVGEDVPNNVGEFGKGEVVSRSLSLIEELGIPIKPNVIAFMTEPPVEIRKLVTQAARGVENARVYDYWK